MAGDDPRAALDAIVRQKGESLNGLSRMLGRNAAYLHQFVTRGSPRALSERDRRHLAAYLQVDEAVLGGATTPARAEEAMVRVPRIDVAASAGPGGVVEEEAARAEIIPQAWLRRLNLHRDQISFVPARGESMEPGIADGDLMLVDHAARTVGPRGAIYVLRHRGVVIVKRLSALSSAAGGAQLRIASDNPAYPTVVAEAGDVEVIGRVVWLSRALR